MRVDFDYRRGERARGLRRLVSTVLTGARGLNRRPLAPDPHPRSPKPYWESGPILAHGVTIRFCLVTLPINTPIAANEVPRGGPQH